MVSTFDDRVIGAFTLVRFADRPTSLTNPTNPGNRFQYDLMSSGDVVYSRPSEPVTSFGLVSPDPKSKTFLQGTNLEFQNPQLASGVDFFNGSMIKSASISNADFANDTISSTELADASLQTADFADLSVLAENIAPLTTSAFASASVSASKIKTNISPLLAADFADGAVTNAKFAVAGIGQTVFADRSIARTAIATKTLLGNRFVNASVAGLVQLSSADFQIGSIQVTKLSSSVANLLNKDKFALSAFQARTQPVDVITSLAPVVALTQTQSLFSAYQGKDFPVFMRLTVPGFVSGSSASAAVELLDSNSNRVFSIHNNGNLHLGFAESATLVTSVPISAKALANMVGVPTKTGDCGSGDINMTTLNIGFSTSGLQSADCISKTINHGLSQLSWHPAEQICLSNGYRLCSVQQYYNACRVGGRIASTKTYITGKLASPTKAITFSVNNTNSCTGTADFTVGSANLTGGPFDFHCCQK